MLLTRLHKQGELSVIYCSANVIAFGILQIHNNFAKLDMHAPSRDKTYNDPRIPYRIILLALLLVGSQWGELVLLLSIAELFHTAVHGRDIVGHIFGLVHT
jgi:hypothetical protein